jgi:uncharacterized protein (DUF1778 family)
MAKVPNVSGIVSLRLAPEEKRLIEEAAERKGWKVASFLRVSALDRAAHILNLSRPTAFDFAGIARRAAESLRAPRRVTICDTSPSVESFGEFGEGQVHLGREYHPPESEPKLSEAFLKDFTPTALTAREVDQLQEAFRLGGGEFITEFLAECRRVVNSPADATLPPPIDPRNLSGPDTVTE